MGTRILQWTPCRIGHGRYGYRYLLLLDLREGQQEEIALNNGRYLNNRRTIESQDKKVGSGKKVEKNENGTQFAKPTKSKHGSNFLKVATALTE